jgi:hypothetical protein
VVLGSGTCTACWVYDEVGPIVPARLHKEDITDYANVGAESAELEIVTLANEGYVEVVEDMFKVVREAETPERMFRKKPVRHSGFLDGIHY